LNEKTLAIVWAAGAATVLLAYFRASLSFRRQLSRSGRRAGKRTEQAVSSCSRAMGLNPIPVLEMDALSGPALFGVWRPRLLFPLGLADQLSDEELRLVVLHELGHLKRRDLFLQGLLVVSQAVHWFNPLVWLAGRLAREDRELACDEFVMAHTSHSGSHAYAKTLLRVLGLSRPGRSMLPAVGILETKNQIKQRIIMITKYQSTNARRLVLGAASILAVSAGLLMVNAAESGSNAAARGAAFLTGNLKAKDGSSDNQPLSIKSMIISVHSTRMPAELQTPVTNLSDDQKRLLWEELKGTRSEYSESPMLTVIPGEPGRIIAMSGFRLTEEQVPAGTIPNENQLGSRGATLTVTANKSANGEFHLWTELKIKSLLGWSATPDGRSPLADTSTQPSFPIYDEREEKHDFTTDPNGWTAVRLKDFAHPEWGTFRMWLLVRVNAESGPDASIAAIVNGRAITQVLVDGLIKSRSKTQTNATPALESEQNQMALRDLIDKELVLQEFERKGLSLDEGTMRNRISDIAKKEFGGDESALRVAVEKQGYTWEEFLLIEQKKIIVQAMVEVITRGQSDTKLRMAKKEEWLQSLRDKATVQIVAKH
jgi:beta-lactamase regulating signal transducer with metallopeptidase domain